MAWTLTETTEASTAGSSGHSPILVEDFEAINVQQPNHGLLGEILAGGGECMPLAACAVAWAICVASKTLFFKVFIF